MLTVVHDGDEANGNDAGVAGGRSLLDEIVRDGARQMLAAALQAEVAAYVEQFADQRDENGHRLVVRNGYHQPRDVLTAAGAVQVCAPRVNDKRVDPDTGERRRFSSAILPAWVRKSPQISEVLPLLYLHGLSSSDFGPALEQFLGSGAGLSATTITRLTSQWQDEAKTFTARDLSGTDYVYLWVDRIHLKVRLEQDKLCLLVMLGVRADGRKELVALTDGYRECTESWADLLRDCRRRGMIAPVLAVGDGALGFWKAVREVFPATREQRCWFHKQANVLAALPKSAHPGALAALKDIYNAEDIAKAQLAIKAFEVDYAAKYPKAVAKIVDDADVLLEFYKHPAEHWIHLRTTNGVDVCHRPPAHEGHQRPRFTSSRNCHGLQADRCRSSSLAGCQRPASGGSRPCRRHFPQRQTPRTPHRHHTGRTKLQTDRNGGRLKHAYPSGTWSPSCAATSTGRLSPLGWRGPTRT